MRMFRTNPAGDRLSRSVAAITATAGLFAAVAASPVTGREPVAGGLVRPAPVQKETVGAFMKGLRPLGDGPALKIGRAYGAEDEDCTIAVAKSTDESGRVRVKRSVACVN